MLCLLRKTCNNLAHSLKHSNIVDRSKAQQRKHCLITCYKTSIERTIQFYLFTYGKVVSTWYVGVYPFSTKTFDQNINVTYSNSSRIMMQSKQSQRQNHFDKRINMAQKQLKLIAALNFGLITSR